ncbi:MAG TPA: fumarylacetoacetate hydrolase family protein [Burkholderiales bacterium]|jgi:2-keto-4-pentenoate hydratase/2-oxohepta-3-ene-1,7-dioic acid hydratase in catechol pathway|nr:fumarylacetoacetate hydrolase family protein [Burkholderiales bacterium]
MKTERRKFLKQAGAAGAVIAASSAATMKAGEARAAAAGTTPRAPTAMPKGMMLLTMRSGDRYTLGIKTDKGILDVAAAAKALKSGAPVTMDELLERGDSGLTELRDRALASSGKGLFLKESEVAFGPCVTNPQKIVCVGLNYARHAKEVGQPLPKMPILFNKFNTSLNSHQGAVRVSAIPATNYDYEAELVIVMGRRASNVSEAEALSYVLGYATGNDFTARDLQSRSSQWMIGKACDGFAPIGPYVVTADLVGDPNNLKIECRVNGEVRQSSNTSDMVFNCAQIVSYASKLMTLEPGDLFFTGTPEGVISGYPKDKQVWLKAGDKLSTTIEKLGELRFSVV